MDINPQTTQSISDDQELAKVLAGVTQTTESEQQTEEPVVVNDTTTAVSVDTPLPTPTIGYNPPAPTDSVADVATEPVPSSELESIKNEALAALRPLVDKLDLAADEKFDTYLLLLRSTDDKALIAPAYAAAQSITDESRKAQALLDVIKEIDFLSAQK